MSEITLYGSALSLYTGKARSYLIKSGLCYRETVPISDHFRQQVLPKMGGRQSIPTIETAAGEVIRDGTAIIDHYEADTNNRFSPNTPKQRIISLLFDVIGAEGLLRPAMHYRWNFPAQNHDFLSFHFASMMAKNPEREQQAEKNMQRMRTACQMFGAVPDTFELVESLYAELLEKLNIHFAEQPYLLGGKPCIGDFGMIAPLYGHLGRDPAPLTLMQTQAVRLFRWVERMNRPELDVGEFDIQDGEYLGNDVVSDSLIDVLKQIAIDFIPETKTASDCINQWLSDQKNLSPSTPVERGVGLGSFDVRGVTVNALAQPYRFYLLKRVQDEYDKLDAADKKNVDDMLAACDMKEVLTIKISRNIGRENNREVWL